MQSSPRRLPAALVSLAFLGTAAGLYQSVATVDSFMNPAADGQVSSTPVKVAAAATSVAPVSSIGAGTAAAMHSAFNKAVAAGSDLRHKIHWVEVRHGSERLKTPDAASRLLLAQAAAQRAGLAEVGLNFADVYGLINAETSWVPRTGVGKTGTHSYGLAQFEPGTAKGLGLRNPNDPVEAVFAAAKHMKHAAEWASDKLDDRKLPPDVYAQKLREGVSVYYNLSWKGRKAWDGYNTASLPVATQRHIANTRIGAERAEELAQQLWADNPQS